MTSLMSLKLTATSRRQFTGQLSRKSYICDHLVTCRKGLAGPDSPDLDDSYLGDEREEGSPRLGMEADQEYHNLINQHRNHLNLQIPPSLQNFR